MPIPLAAIIPALLSGATLVPHASGGLILTGASGYIGGTFVSSSMIASLLSLGQGIAALGAGGLAVLGITSTPIIGSTGFMGTGIGATGLTGLGISLGVVSTTPLWVPVASAAAIVGGVGLVAHGLVKGRKRRKLFEEFESILETSGYSTEEFEHARSMLERIVKKIASTRRKKEAVFTEEEAAFLTEFLKRAANKSHDPSEKSA